MTICLEYCRVKTNCAEYAATRCSVANGVAAFVKQLDQIDPGEGKGQIYT